MITVKGKRFYCEQCGANVFTTDKPEHYICNGCGTGYTSAS